MRNLPFALQLFTVREPLQADMAKTLAAVKKAGYNVVETVTCLSKLTPAEYKDMLDDAGLRAVSDHVLFDALSERIDSVIESAKTLGVHYLVLSWMGADAADWYNGIEKLDQIGATLKQAGLQLAYHNHAHELVLLDGKPILDIIFERTQPENLVAELDTYWIAFGGKDPVEYLRKLVKRCPLLHVKDMTADRPHTFAEAGKGILPWNAIFDAAEEADVEWYIVEQDECPGDPLESIRISAQFMAAQ